MKRTRAGTVAIVVFALAAAWWPAPAAADPAIVSYENGVLTWTNDDPSLEYRVESSPALDLAFTGRYEHLQFIRPTGSTVSTPLPQFFRVAGTSALPSRVYRASDLPFIVDAGTNARVTVDWADTPQGPWRTNWTPPLELPATGAAVHVEAPHYLRVHFVNCPSNFAGCADWSNQVDPASNRVVSFPVSGFNYAPKCLLVRAGQTVTFSGAFGGHPLVADCQDHAALTNLNSGSSATYSFPYPGYYGYHCGFHGSPGGSGMSGNIRVIP